MTEPRDRFLPSVPGDDIEQIFNAAPGDEIRRGKFARAVEDDEVAFVSCTYRRLLATWRQDPREEIRDHAEAVMARFSP